ncbi:MAG TPA: hypothetical protein VKU19_05790 [Bryobacteraceae bacterium]|nr:hypothetical protein [Bryobacteraceae bacterium]
MADDPFEEVDKLLQLGDSAGAFDFLAHRYSETKDYRALFEARLMRKRLDLGLPAYQLRELSALPQEVQSTYGEAVTAAAREVGNLFLADGEIVNAWPYLRATGDLDRVAEAIESVEPDDHCDAIIQIAFQEGVHPRKGLELILKKYGIYQALSALGMAPVEKDREKCIGLLARDIHREILQRIGNVIEAREGFRPDASSIVELIPNRDWLFGDYDSYVDTSHLVSILQYSPEASDPELLRLFVDLCEYGKHLSMQFRVQGQPPFEDVYADYGHYARALLRENVEAHLDHFRRKLAESDPERVGTLPAQLLVKLLARLALYPQALSVALAHFPDASANELNCPPAMELCQMSQDFAAMKKLARERGDLLGYTAASLPEHSKREI